MYEITKVLLKRSRKELIAKVTISLILRGLLLVIPIFWSNAINNLTEGIFRNAYYLVILSLVFAILYYLAQYFNQVFWFKFYNKLYMEYTTLVMNDNKINNLTVAEYTNIINNDIDIICTFMGNLITRIIQVLEFVIIYVYFLSLNNYIFIITVLVSLLMIGVLMVSGNILQYRNLKRKESLDHKTVTTHKMYNMVKNDQDMTKVNKTFKHNCIDYLKNNTSFNLSSSFFTYLVLGILEVCRYGIILYSVYLVIQGRLEIGTILLIYTYYDKIITNFEVVGTISAEYQSFLVSLKRLNKVGS